MTLGRMETLCSSDEMPSRIGDCWLAGRFLLNRLNDLESNANGIMYSFCVINLSVTQHHTHVSPAGSTRVAWISPVSNMDRWDRILLCTFKNFAVVCALYHCHYRPITGEVKQKSFITLIMLRNSLKYLRWRTHIKPRPRWRLQSPFSATIVENGMRQFVAGNDDYSRQCGRGLSLACSAPPGPHSLITGPIRFV